VATLKQLDGRLARIIVRLNIGIRRVVEDVGTAIAEELVPATPVDTGFARANWRPSLNAPASVPVSQLDPTGAATIAKIATVSKRWTPGDVLFITNNAPYIGALNAGSSPQAGPGFVQDAADRGTERAITAFERRGVI
jgi:hypothetical protein